MYRHCVNLLQNILHNEQDFYSLLLDIETAYYTRTYYKYKRATATYIETVSSIQVYISLTCIFSHCTNSSLLSHERRHGRGRNFGTGRSESKTNAFNRFLGRKQVWLVPKHALVEQI